MKIIVGWLLLCTAAWANPVTQGQYAYDEGQLHKAVQLWQTALDTLPVTQQVRVRLQLAEAYKKLGEPQAAIQVLEQAINYTEELTKQALILSHLSDAFLTSREFEHAQQAITDSLTLAQQTDDPDVLAHVLNNQGNTFATLQRYAEARVAYEQAWQFAQQANQTALLTRIILNQIQAAIYHQDIITARQQLTIAFTHLQQLPEAASEQRLGLLGLGRLALQLKKQFSEPDPALLNLAYQSLIQAEALSLAATDKNTTSYVYGYLGQLYQTQQRFEEALQLTRRALFIAEEIQARPIIYRWYAQLAEIYRQQGEWEKALNAYQQAIYNLQPARPQLASAYRSSRYSFQQFVEPVYIGMVDLLLQQARQAGNKAQQQFWRRKALEQLELLKGVELAHFFQDFQNKCFLDPPHEHPPSDYLDQGTAALYPLMLSKRLELLLVLADGTIEQFSMPVSEQQFQEILRAFRENLVIRSHFQYLDHAWLLYDWLIRPVQATLLEHNIETLVFIPDNLLRTVPLAALNDKQTKQFLIEQFALVTTPSLYLTPDAKQLNAAQVQILLAGLSDSVQGFPALLNVPQELHKIQQLYPHQHTLLKNQDFSVANLQNLLQNKPFNMIHIASHGQFDNDPNKTFLLTHDSKLNIRQFEALLQTHTNHQMPIDLLTLSACQTAVGDERAALGLAGMAIKAGVRSTLATLWAIDDNATSELVAEFYQQLQSSITKAKALQNAQRHLLLQPRFRHPAYWSAFLLIGNWL